MFLVRKALTGGLKVMFGVLYVDMIFVITMRVADNVDALYKNMELVVLIAQKGARNKKRKKKWIQKTMRSHLYQNHMRTQMIVWNGQKM
jgi:hypothetical protein